MVGQGLMTRVRPEVTEGGTEISAILPLSQDMVYTIIVLVCMETKAI